MDSKSGTNGALRGFSSKLCKAGAASRCRLLAPAHRALAFSLALKVSLEAESPQSLPGLWSAAAPPGRTRDEAEPWFSLQLSQTPSSSFGPQ